MKRFDLPWLGLVSAATSAALLSLLVACTAQEPSDSEPSESAVTSEEDTSSARVYTVQGIVRGIPTAERPGSQLSIRHQAIPDFVDFSGKETGMESMTMPFPTADDLSLEGIAPGNAVEFELAVDWDADQPVQITKMVKLPEGTEVSFEDVPID